MLFGAASGITPCSSWLSSQGLSPRRRVQIASQGGDATWPGYAAGIAGAVVTACGVALTQLKAVEKLRYAHERLGQFQAVALKAENGMALGGGAELVTTLTDELTEIRRRELPD